MSNAFDSEYKQHLIKVYDEEAIDRNSREHPNWKRQEVERFSGYIPKSVDRKPCMIDLGCGVGNESLMFEEQGFDVSAIDISIENVNICRSKGLDARQMDFYELLFPECKFDAAFAMSSLLHVPKESLPVVLKEVSRCLKDNALFYFGVYKGFYNDSLPYDKNKFVAMYQTEELIQLVAPYFKVIDVHNFRPSKVKRYLALILQK